MSRSPLAYPLTRSADADSGGAADLQTDIMRFMAILALCLVAIFALVQSIPLAPELPREPPAATAVEQLATGAAPAERALPPGDETPAAPSEPAAVQLTRPRWVSTFAPRSEAAAPRSVADSVDLPAAENPAENTSPPSPAETQAPAEPAASPDTGFTLRFASDLALTRLVASGQIGFYAFDAGRARRMSVRDSRLSFWDASTPAAFHEMEASTVPAAVVDALKNTGADASQASYGVTLPARMRGQLDSLMREHSGGALVIHADGELRLEQS